MGGGGGVIGAIVGAVVTVIGVVTAQPEIIMMGVTMMASSIISAVTAPKIPNQSTSAQLNTGTNVQVPPATNNTVPVVYGNTFIGGTVTDLSITSDNQNLYYVLTLCEVTGNGADNIQFGDIYYGGKKVILSGTTVTGLLDTSTGLTDTAVNGLINIYLYNNGSNSPVNTSQSAISVMQSSGLVYQWGSTDLMTNAVFAIVQITYNANANLTSISQTQFEILNPRTDTGDVLEDYLTNTVYGAAIPSNQLDTASLAALTTYSNQLITFNNYLGVPSTQPRFKFNGAIDTTQNVMANLQDMTQCCDCLLKYNEIYGKWSVIVQTPTTTVVMDINDSNIISAITVTTLDISSTYNIAQCQFPDITLNSSFNTSTIDLSVVDPTLLYPNEPPNSQTIQLPLVNNDVQAQLLATRFLKSARQDLQIQCTISFQGLELEAGDIVTVTNANYGWTAKPFRALRVEQTFTQSSGITVALLLQEYDAAVYNDASVTQYQPAPNSGLSSPNIFGTVPAPVVLSNLNNLPVPTIGVQVTTSTAGITQYAEVWYSAYASPTSSQLIYGGTTAIQPAGEPYGNSVVMPTVFLAGIPAGNWYFFSRMVNSLATSSYSPASTIFNWRPATFQYSERYLCIAYANSATGTGFTTNPRGMTYYGISNSNIPAFDLTPSDYTWYLATPSFGSSGVLNYVLFCNRGNNLVSFAVGNAAFSAGTAGFVPTDPNYDPTIWQGLEDGFNIIDLNARTGQLIQTGTTTVGTGEIAISNNPQGQVVASLAQLLSFPGGASTLTSAVATLTIDTYGRVVGFSQPDLFGYTMTAIDASSGQTLFSVTRGAEYLINNCWVFQNGCLLDTSQYTDTAGSTGAITLTVGANLNDIVTIISFASVNTSTGAYNSFTRNSATLNNVGSYTASGFTLINGNELLFLNGTVINAQDYNISGQTISFINSVSGDLQIIQWTNNNLGVPNGSPSNIDVYTTIGQSLYPFTFNPLAFNLWNNGVLLLETVDYSVTAGSYTLAQTPNSNLNILVEQSFNRTGAV